MKELREELQNLASRVTEIDNRQLEILKELQDMCESLNLPKYSSWLECTKQLRGYAKRYVYNNENWTYEGRAEYLYAENCELRGKLELLLELRHILEEYTEEGK